MNEDLMKFIVEPVTTNARKVREDAGYAGSWNDGGAAEMLRQLHFFQCGVGGVVPDNYKNIAREFDRLQLEKVDPEYQQFLRLQEKFKDI